MHFKNINPIHQIEFPIDVEIIIPEDDPVRLLYEVTEGLDYTCLYKNYSTLGRNPVIAPETCSEYWYTAIWKEYILAEN